MYTLDRDCVRRREISMEESRENNTISFPAFACFNAFREYTKPGEGKQKYTIPTHKIRIANLNARRYA
jgi:hypothetical protein